MKAAQGSYPKRPQLFALKFTRLMGKVCLASQIGADACYLLTQVVMTEDAKGYSSPVLFWNNRLADVIGCGSDDSLLRARKKAVEAGWLHYERGAKGKAARYWVIIPPQYGLVDDQPVDENPSEYTPDSPAELRENNQTKGVILPQIPPQKCGIISDSTAESGEKAERIPRECAEHSSLPLPDLRAKDICTEPPKPAASVLATTEPAILVFPIVGKGPKEWSLVDSQISKWRQAYPNLDILAECKKALAWCEANPARRKTAKGMCAFLVNWLNRATNNGGSARASGYRSRAQVQDDYLLEQFASIANTSEASHVG